MSGIDVAYVHFQKFIFSQTKLTSILQLIGPEIISSLLIVGSENVLSHEKIIDDPHRKICLWKFDHHLILKNYNLLKSEPVFLNVLWSPGIDSKA
jgi:hypothetical protein